MYGRGETRMNWIRRIIRNWLQQEEPIMLKETVVSSRDHLRNEGLNFTLHRAVGGHIFESRKYNEKTDRHENTLYMIHEDQDFAKQVAQAIMLEQMKI
jgi:hypothetical protein